MTIQPGGKDSSVLLATTKTKRQNKPAALFHKSLLKKEFPRMAKAVTNQVLFDFFIHVAINFSLLNLFNCVFVFVCFGSKEMWILSIEMFS